MDKTNLCRAMACFNLSEEMLSAELRVDRAQINRWKNGKRTLRWHTPHTQGIARYLLALPYPNGREALLAMLSQETNWQGDDASLPDELAAWLCRPIEPLDDSGIAHALHGIGTPDPGAIKWPDADVPLPGGPYGHIYWADMLGHIAYALRSGKSRVLTIFIPLDGGVLPMGRPFHDLFRYFMGDDGLRAQILIASNGYSHSMNALLSQWVPVLSKGNITLLHTQERSAIRHTVLGLSGEEGAYCLLQPIANDSPCCLYMGDGSKSSAIRREMAALVLGAEPLLTLLSDRDLPLIEKVFYEEFVEDGGYDILKSGINTMFIPHGDFAALLLRKGVSPDEVERCTGRFIQFQQAMEARIMQCPVRELMDLNTLKRMVEKGSYVLPGVYFDHKGLIEADGPAIAAMCRGYAAFLRAYDNLEIRLSANAPQFLDKLCWHIKSKRHVLLQTWHGAEPVSIYITNQQLIREFTRNFQAAWQREPPVSRDTLIRTFEQWGRG